MSGLHLHIHCRVKTPSLQLLVFPKLCLFLYNIKCSFYDNRSVQTSEHRASVLKTRKVYYDFDKKSVPLYM